MYKKLFVFILSIAMLISLAPLSVFADSTYSFIVPKADSDLSASELNGDSLNAYTYNNYTYNSGNTHYDVYNGHCVNSTNYHDDVYFFGYKWTAGSGSNVRTVYSIVYCVPTERIVPSGSTSYPVIRYTTGLGTSVQTANLLSSHQTNSTYNLYYRTGSSSNELDLYDGRLNFPVQVNMYDSIDEGFAALREAIDNGTTGGGPSVTPKGARLTIPAGNVAYISVANGWVGLKVDISPNTFVSNYVSNQCIGTADHLPTSNSDLVFNSSSFGTQIRYYAGNKTSIFGSTSLGMYDYPTNAGEYTGYIVIYNPIYDNGGNVNPTISVDVSRMIGVVQYSLNSFGDRYGYTGEGNIDDFYVATWEDVNEDGTFNYLYSSTVDGNTTTQSAISPPVGGYNIVEESSDQTIGGLIGRLLNLLSAPIRHIQQLFTSGSSFMQWLGELWKWLPDPVYTVLISALIVLFVIGVIKFLWK